MQVGSYKEVPYYQLVNMKTADMIRVDHPLGKKFYLVSVTITVMGGYGTNDYTPYPQKLSVISNDVTYLPMKVISDEWGVEIEAYGPDDYYSISHDAALSDRYFLKDLGEIYVRKNLYKEGKEKEFFNSWVMYEVPESFNKANAFFKADLGDSSPVWKMHDLLAEVGVQKSSHNGIITVSFAGGPNSNLVNDVDVTVTKADGTVISETIRPIIGDNVEIAGTKGEKDHVVVVLNSYSCEAFKKFDGYI